MSAGQAHAARDLRDADAPKGLELFCAGVEMHHLFLLIHDDVFDQGTLRRGQPTLPVALRAAGHVDDAAVAENLAVVVGDVLHAKATELMLAGLSDTAAGLQAYKPILASSYVAAAAEFQDLCGWPHFQQANHKDMRQLQLDKGASHRIVAPLIAGLRLGAAGLEVEHQAVAWASSFGVAFQSFDDLSDLLSPIETTGKDAMQDLLAGHLSLVLFLVRQAATPTEWSEVTRIFSRGQHSLSRADRNLLFGLLGKYKIAHACLALIDEELAKAAQFAASFDADRVLGRGLSACTQALVAQTNAIRALADGVDYTCA